MSNSHIGEAPSSYLPPWIHSRHSLPVYGELISRDMFTSPPYRSPPDGHVNTDSVKSDIMLVFFALFTHSPRHAIVSARLFTAPRALVRRPHCRLTVWTSQMLDSREFSPSLVYVCRNLLGCNKIKAVGCELCVTDGGCLAFTPRNPSLHPISLDNVIP